MDSRGHHCYADQSKGAPNHRRIIELPLLAIELRRLLCRLLYRGVLLPAIRQCQLGHKVLFRLAEQFLFDMFQGIVDIYHDKFIRNVCVEFRHISIIEM